MRDIFCEDDITNNKEVKGGLNYFTYLLLRSWIGDVDIVGRKMNIRNHCPM